MRATEMLRDTILQEWNAATDHAFCKQLADGSLPLDKMRWYLVQDYKFIDQFVRLLATSIAHAPTLADAVPAAQFLGLVTSTENTYFLRSFEALDVSPEMQNAEPAPETVAFQTLMQEARRSGRYEQMLAVLVVAEWSYLSWGERYTDYADDLPFWFAEWIDLHSGAGFAGVVAHLRGQLDAIWDGLTPAQQEDATRMFQAAVRCERAFFDAALVS
ncbi:MAG: TenA family protein [Pseudomonadota bacterium]